MLTNIRLLVLSFLTVFALMAGTVPSFAQTTVASTTFSAAVDATQQVVTVASGTDIDADDLLFADREVMIVRSRSGTSVTVRRGQMGTGARAHASGAIVYFGAANNFNANEVVAGSTCTSTAEIYLPRIVIPTGNVYQCTSSVWHMIGSLVGTLTVSYVMNANASLADQAFFIADRRYEVIAIAQIHSTAGSDASAVNLQVTKDDGTEAPGAGDNLLTNNSDAGFDLKGTANTKQAGTLTATTANLRLAVGDRLAVDYAGVLTAVVGVVVTVTLAPR